MWKVEMLSAWLGSWLRSSLGWRLRTVTLPWLKNWLAEVIGGGLTVEVDEVDFGVWCPACALPSAVRAEVSLYRLTRGGVFGPSVAVCAVCHSCGVELAVD